MKGVPEEVNAELVGVKGRIEELELVRDNRNRRARGCVFNGRIADLYNSQ